jgi:hypothetical protein
MGTFEIYKALIVLFLFTIIMLSSCCENKKDTYNLIPDNEKLIFNINDTILYISDLGRVDTMSVTFYERRLSSRENMDECGTVTYNEQLDFGLKSINQKSNNAFSYSYIYPQTFNISCLQSVVYNKSPSQYTFIDSLAINNTVYYKVYKFLPYYSSDSISESLKLSYFIFQVKFGILQFKFKNDETWELLKYITTIRKYKNRKSLRIA